MGRPKTAHDAFDDNGGTVLKTAVNQVLMRREFAFVAPYYTYAVRCAVDKVNKATLQCCSKHLIATIHRIHERRVNAGVTLPLAILACGVWALHALGIHVRSEDEALNRSFENVDVSGIRVNVVYTRSLKAIAAQDGKFNMLVADVERAARYATGTNIKVLTRREIEANYEYPKTLDEVRDLVDRVIAYSNHGVNPAEWPISFDTETNTLHPHWEGTKLLSVSFAWDEGKAAAITLWHPENTFYDPAAAYEEVKRLLLSNKRLIWHNGKYDFKVFWRLGWPQGPVGNTYWDTMLAEHVLEEDKKQGYSLKVLTKQLLPQLAGYEDVLQAMLEQENEETSCDNETEEVIEAASSNAVERALEIAIKNKVIKNEKFQAKTLEKAIAAIEDKDPELAATYKLLLAAKRGGEFRKTNKAKELAKQKTKGGFENIPLQELLFYSCVDADATRRIAVIQARRMAEETARTERMRREVEYKRRFSRNPQDHLYPVQRWCTIQKPLFTLVQRDYLPRQVELAKIEYNGIRVDQDYLRWGMESLKSAIAHSREQVFTLAGGYEFKINSSKRLGQLLFSEGYPHPEPEVAEQLARDNPGEVFYEHGRIRYKPHAYTAKGAIQTSDNVLKSLIARFRCPLANAILAYKKADKARNTFFANIEVLSTYFGDGRLHAGYGLVNTSTGRLSSSVKIGNARFNAQNVPKGYIGAMRNFKGELICNDKGEPIFEGVKCKKLFIPSTSDFVFCNADAKNAEVSVYAAYAKDPALIQALKDGLDPHCFFASQCLNPALVAAGLTGEAKRIALERAGIDEDHAWTYEDFLAGKDCNYGNSGADGAVCVHNDHSYCKRLKALRDNIKRLVFGMLYGAGITKIAEIAGINPNFAKKIQELLFAKFPTIRTFMEQTKWELRTFGFVEAFNGRKRRFLLGRNAPAELRAQAERRAINFRVQGTNSDIVLSVLCWLAPVIERDMGGRLLLTVHDSIGFEIPAKYVLQAQEAMVHYGTRAVAKAFPWMPVPYRWDLEVGPSYGELSSVANYLAGKPNLVPVEFTGYVEEEQFEDLRDPDAFTAPERTKP
jgi:DNA polymerase I-like protein with 3'-5' exonuclease and polymerase domains